ncbi:MAG: hypothetical protein ACREQX_08360, partial [Candidatus Binataceae bacterium]
MEESGRKRSVLRSEGLETAAQENAFHVLSVELYFVLPGRTFGQLRNREARHRLDELGLSYARRNLQSFGIQFGSYVSGELSPGFDCVGNIGGSISPSFSASTSSVVQGSKNIASQPLGGSFLSTMTRSRS